MKTLEGNVTTVWMDRAELTDALNGMIVGAEREKALAELDRAEARGFMGCDAVFVDGVFDGLHERAVRGDGRFDWGRGQDVTKRNRFVDGHLVPDPEWKPDPPELAWEHADLRCEVRMNRMGYRCGYASVPPGHPWHGIEYNHCTHGDACPDKPADPDEWYHCDHRPESIVHVHGGLTFSGATDDGWWTFGFDCAHAGDSPSPEAAAETRRRYGIALWDHDGHHWTLDEVRDETEGMARVLAAVGEPL